MTLTVMPWGGEFLFGLERAGWRDFPDTRAMVTLGLTAIGVGLSPAGSWLVSAKGKARPEQGRQWFMLGGTRKATQGFHAF